MPAPSAELVAPTATTPLPSELTTLMQLQDWASPSGVLLKGINLFFDFNPYEWVSKEFAGDWEAASKVGSALTHLGAYMAAMSKEIDDLAGELGADWDGHAAQAADHYFNELVATVRNLQDPLKQMADDYDQIAVGMERTAQAMQDAMNMLMDLLIEAGIAALATASTSWTGIGAVVGGAATAYKAYKIERTWSKVVSIHGAAMSTINGLLGTIAGGLSYIEVDEQLVLSESYDHPAVA